jgi:hypothetical protein
LTRETWQTASEKLGAADVVALVGYSLPPTDLVSSGMLAERLAKADKIIEIVNPHPGKILDRLTDVGIQEDQIWIVGQGYDVVEEFVGQLEEEARAATFSALSELSGDPLLLVATNDLRVSSVVRLAAAGDELLLIMEPRPEISALQHARPWTGQLVGCRSDFGMCVNVLRAAISPAWWL